LAVLADVVLPTLGKRVIIPRPRIVAPADSLVELPPNHPSSPRILIAGGYRNAKQPAFPATAADAVWSCDTRRKFGTASA
jgi:hypothetical protein